MVAVTIWIGMNKLWSVASPYVGCATVLKELCVSFTYCKHVNVRAPYTAKRLHKISLCLPISMEGLFQQFFAIFFRLSNNLYMIKIFNMSLH